ncbi:Uu.00g088590.m01.CDS01 [Anthostomella pinea]|uniref:Uu.00g088590.m01.CDS01 n=1 Tax=Anthostomella pinea TaxID=933095 RepID=A0AAI8VH50_9PEZI|nr:Uu.00g088590.m01.CDS01 [Anthostomella pinea]
MPEDNCTARETSFPRVEAPERAAAATSPEGRVWRNHGQDGLDFRTVKTNALFWVNLLANGTVDGRTKHAGLPVDSSVKR